jgi:hypothetical protein
MVSDYERERLMHYIKHNDWCIIMGIVGKIEDRLNAPAIKSYVPIAPFTLAGVKDPSYERTYTVFSSMVRGEFKGQMSHVEINQHCFNVRSWLDDSKISRHISFHMGMQLIRFCREMRVKPEFHWAPSFLRSESQIAIFHKLVDSTAVNEVRKQHSRTISRWMRSRYFLAQGFLNSCLFRQSVKF